MRPIVVIGLGNEYRGDDGVGPAVVRALHGRLPPPIRVVEVADDVDLLDVWAGAALAVVVDAVLCTPPIPGRVHRWVVGDGVPAPLGGHGVDVAAALALARVLGRSPERVVVYAIEGARVGTGAGLSAAVRRAVPATARAIASEVISGNAPHREPTQPVDRRAR
ncbi:hydrogenase maturation protease [Rhodococcus spongiicola]|uniref:Hydrogenase maturation protease n=1 Tax=Rhodococcus spongiicola TaxID=2487352 RepID=A0A3S3ZLX7_9NOCA|nr:hydrogenase maturation protease [Rhodococcus spongiicola]